MNIGLDHLVLIRYREFLDQLSICCLLKKDSDCICRLRGGMIFGEL
jgi:hypothetical protein